MVPWKDFDAALYKGVVYFVSTSIQADVRERLIELLDAGGAQPCPTFVTEATQLKDLDVRHLTHIITDSVSFAEYEDDQVKNRVCMVTPMWVCRCWDLQHKQDPLYFSPEPSKFFSGVCVSMAALPGRDEEHIAAIVQSYGGQYRPSVTKEVTHLICIKPVGQKYHQVMTNGLQLGMKVVLPAWIFDSLLAMNRLHTGQYEFPKPSILDSTTNGVPPARSKTIASATKIETATHTILGGGSAASYMTTANTTYLKIACHEPNEQSKYLEEVGPSTVGDSTLAGLRIYMASSLEFSAAAAKSLKQTMLQAGAAHVFVAETPSTSGRGGQSIFEQVDQLEGADYVICPRRTGWEFWTAYGHNKNIANFAWLVYVLVLGQLEAPMDHMMHYPSPATPIPAFKGYDMTITNYTGQSRDLLKRMIDAMGGSVRGDMNRGNSHVIAASKTGKKVDSAIDWHIPVVNHTWLNECYARWEAVNPANFPNVTAFPPGINYMNLLGHHKLQKQGVDAWANQNTADRDQALAELEEIREMSKALLPPEPASPPQDEPMPPAPQPSNGRTDMSPNPSLEARIADDLIPRTGLKAAKSSPAVLAKPAATKTAKAKARPASVEPTPSSPAQPKPSSSRTVDRDMEMAVPARARRHAAEAATTKVQAAAKDMLVHEKEKKRKRPSEVTAQESDPEVGTSKRRRPSRSKNNSDDEDAQSKKSTKTKSKAASSRAANSDSEAEDGWTGTAQPKSKKSSPAKGSSRSAGTPKRAVPELIYIMTTGVELPEAQLSKIKKMGLFVTEDPAECTHVVAAKISRTVKFLCAMPRSPHFVTKEWVEATVKASRVADPDRYRLKDVQGEKQWKLSFSDVLKQARKTTLFHDMTFYITKKTTPEVDQLKPIVAANGGRVSTTIPSAQTLVKSPDKHFLVSCTADRPIWSKIVAANAAVEVYQPELILLSALRQRMCTAADAGVALNRK